MPNVFGNNYQIGLKSLASATNAIKIGMENTYTKTVKVLMYTWKNHLFFSCRGHCLCSSSRLRENYAKKQESALTSTFVLHFYPVVFCWSIVKQDGSMARNNGHFTPIYCTFYGWCIRQILIKYLERYG